MLNNAATEFGPVNAEMKFTEDGATVTFDNDFQLAPQRLVIRMPYFVDLVKINADAQSSERDGDVIRLSHDVTELTMKRTAKPGSRST